MSRREPKWLVDKCTPRQRRLLDALERARPDMAPLIMYPAAAEICYPLRMNKHRGCYPINESWIRREIERVRSQRRRDKKKDIETHIGAFI